MTKFIVLTTQRTGSSWLIDLLSNHPEISAYGEIFINRIPNRENPWVKGLMPPISFYEFKQNNCERHFLVINYLRYLDKMVFGNKANGFKMMYNQLGRNTETILPLIFNNFRIIHLIRKNILDIIISRKHLHTKGMKHFVNDEQKNKIRTVSLNPDTIIQEIGNIERKVDFFRKLLFILPLRTLTVFYEDLVKEKETTLNKIFKFLNVNGNIIISKTRFRKIHTIAKSDLIENFDAIQKILSATKYKEFLEN